jgi:hypothetical protein
MKDFRGELRADGVRILQVGENDYRGVIIGISAYLRGEAVNGSWMDDLKVAGYNPGRRAA